MVRIYHNGRNKLAETAAIISRLAEAVAQAERERQTQGEIDCGCEPFQKIWWHRAASLTAACKKCGFKCVGDA